MSTPLMTWTGLLAMLLSVALPVHAAPRWDWDDVPASLDRLINARDAEAHRIRAEIKRGPTDLAKEKRIARSWGLPLTTDEWPGPVPADEDAAPLYNRFGELMTAHPWTDEEAPSGTPGVRRRLPLTS